MTIVFVYGLPETKDIWNPLRSILGKESITVSLLGFGIKFHQMIQKAQSIDYIKMESHGN